MVAFENNLFILALVLAGLAALVAALGALGRTQLRRAWRFLVAWWERDQRAEAQALQERECRQRAEAEIAEACGDEPLVVTDPTTTTEATPAQPVRADAPHAPVVPSPYTWKPPSRRNNEATTETAETPLTAKHQ